MQALNAPVENGRIKLDEPTDLPEGKLLELVPFDEVFQGGGDDLDDAERAALDESVREGIDDMEASFPTARIWRCSASTRRGGSRKTFLSYFSTS